MKMMSKDQLEKTGMMERYNKLKDILSGMESVMVALSGGVDSSLLLKASHDVLGDKVMAVTAKSPIRPEKEFSAASALTGELGVDQIVIDTREMEDEQVAGNDIERCYFCKKKIFSEVLKLAGEHGVNYVCEGSNADDDKAYRPGAKALKELGVRSPLKEAGLTKKDIRALSRELGLAAWNEPSQSCYLTRFPYNTKIAPDDIERVANAEEYLKSEGFTDVRVREYNDLARVEVPKERITDLFPVRSERIIEKFKELGYNYITIDLEGLRSGSMDEGRNG